MARDKSTFIKLDRNIMEWRWYKNPATFKMFVHLLLKANIKDHDFENAKIPRGSLATSYASLAAETGLSYQQARTAVKHLVETGELTVRRHSRFQVISIVNYTYYQSQLTIKNQSDNNHLTINQQQSKNGKNDKEGGEERARGATPVSPSASFEDEGETWIEREDGVWIQLER